MRLPRWLPAEKGRYASWRLVHHRGLLAEADGHGDDKPGFYRIGTREVEMCSGGLRGAMQICEAAWGLVGENEGKVGRRIIGRQPRQGAA